MPWAPSGHLNMGMWRWLEDPRCWQGCDPAICHSGSFRAHVARSNEMSTGAVALLAQGTLVSPTQRWPSSNGSVATSSVLVAIIFLWEFGRKPRVESRGTGFCGSPF